MIMLLKYFILEICLAEDNHLAMVISEIVTLDNDNVGRRWKLSSGEKAAI